MKRVIGLIIILVLIMFLIPILFTKRFKLIETINSNEIKDEAEVQQYNYNEYSKIKLLHTQTGNVEEIELDEYLLGVVSSEMPASYEDEALKAQAIVARTYTIYTIKNNNKHNDANICDDSKCCQAWISKEDRLNKWSSEEANSNWNKIEKAVNDTKGKIIVYNGEPINAFFHANSGGITDTATAVWGGTNYPYLQSVQTNGEEEYSGYQSDVTISKEEFINKIKEYHNEFDIDFNQESSIEVLNYTEGGRIDSIKIGNLNLKGVEIRNIFKLKSAKFTIEIQDENIKFNVIGYGHGVGMSQNGAEAMAKSGKNYEEIIKHYYTGTEIVDI